jgi:deoxyribonuclease-1-like protein
MFYYNVGRPTIRTRRKWSLLLFILFLLLADTTLCNINICTWNLKDFGKSKSNEEIEFIANTVKQFDLVAIQEVVAGYGGPQAVARLVESLNRKGSKWDYTISDPTSSSAYKTERYAFIWKTSRVSKKGDAWLEKKYNLEIDREPFFINLLTEGKDLTLVNFHAITKSRQPETEIKYFKFIPTFYPNQNLIFLGDFNLTQSHSVFNPLKKMGYQPLLQNQKTSLRYTCMADDCLASAFDNVFLQVNKVKIVKFGIVPFYKSFIDLKEARSISDHVPVFVELSVR